MFQNNQLQTPEPELKSASKTIDKTTKLSKAVPLNVVQSTKPVESVADLDIEKETSLPAESTSKRRLGKRSDPEYTLTNFLLKKETYQDSRITLLQKRKNDPTQPRDLSELMEQLLSTWLMQAKTE